MMDAQPPRRWRAATVIAALALTVAACDVFSGEGTDDGAVADQEDADDEDADDEDEDADDEDAEDDVGEPAEPRVWEVEEAVRQDGLEVVVERIVAEEFHTEVELRAVNTTADETVELFGGGSVFDETSLFDDRDRRFVYQPPAGFDASDWAEVGPGERLEATLAFRGAVQPDAELLTFQLAPDDRDQLSWEVPVDAGGDQ